ncbi:class E sortase [Schaalia canis]|uniref:Class E sortase n=1 Tax=Schaalia canis TaxID=100469 RepID=A0A3P1SER6_9ACTO|nr:class E sortase [Schaalia canis]RRC95410.1 class E sortase [Schaalia canis]
MAEHVRRRPPLSPAARVFYGTIGVIGELLITAAVVVALFAFWQLYYTSYKVEGPRQERIAEFATKHKPAVTNEGERRTDDPPPVATPALGETYGLIHFPTWDWMRTPLTQGTAQLDLDNGNAGHYADSAQPGEIGNFSVAGHRRTSGENFRWIDRLKDGDKVIVEVADTYYVYSMKRAQIVGAEEEGNERVIAPVIDDPTFSLVPSERWMTMTSCHPEWSNYERYIAHLQFEYWTPKSTGVPAELVAAPYNKPAAS